jgi:hypothetical protein
LKTVEAIDSLLASPAAVTEAATTGAAARTCGPTSPDGTRILTLNALRPLTVVEGIAAVEPSQVNWSRVLPGKLVPTTVTDIPAGPLEGDVVMAGAVARAEAYGRVKAAPTRRMERVAAQSRHGVRFGDWTGATSGTQRVPSQKDMCGGSIRRPG